MGLFDSKFLANVADAQFNFPVSKRITAAIIKKNKQPNHTSEMFSGRSARKNFSFIRQNRKTQEDYIFNSRTKDSYSQ